MEKKLFFLLNLHLFTEKQLFYILCFVTIINMLIGAAVFKYKKYFIELYDLIILIFCIIEHAYVLFLIEHITFFACFFYLQGLLVLVGLFFRKYNYGKV